MDYKREGDTLTATVTLPTQTVVLFKAANLQKQNTGLHANVSVWAKRNGSAIFTKLEGSYDNFDRMEPRVKLCNASYAMLKDPDPAAYEKGRFRADLLNFCDGLGVAAAMVFRAEALPGAEAIEPTFLLYPYVTLGAGTILYGPPKSGKSFIALAMAQSISHGLQQLWPTVAGTVLFLNLERPRGEVLSRLGCVNVALGLPRQTLLLMVHARGRSLTDVLSALQADVLEHAVQLVILDSISRAGVGTMVDDKVANAIMDMLNSLKVAWLAIGHTPYATDEKLFGSRMFLAAADTMVRCLYQRSGASLGVKLEVTDSNDLPELPPEMWALDFQGYHLHAIRKAEHSEFPDLLAKTKVSWAESIDSYIRDQVERQASPTQIAKALGFNRPNVSSYLKHSPLHVGFKKGREILYGLKEP